MGCNMKSVTLMFVIAMTLFVALAVPSRLAAQDAQVQNQQKHTRYAIKVLDTLGGTQGEAWGLNNRGLVAGPSTLPGDTALDAFLWSKGVITDLGSLGGPISLTFTKPNERGEDVGYSNTSTLDPNGEDFCNGLGTFLICLPFVWKKGVMTALPTLGGTNGQALGINNRGQIVGQAETPNVDPCSPFALQVEAVVWRDHQIEQVLPPLGGTVAVANAINDNGDAVGLSGCITGNVYAVLWQHGTPINLGTLGGVFGNIPFAINNRGQVIGQSDLPGDTLHHGFLWQNGVMTDLGGLPGLPTTQADDINNQGQVVGVAQDANSDESSGMRSATGIDVQRPSRP